MHTSYTHGHPDGESCDGRRLEGEIKSLQATGDIISQKLPLRPPLNFNSESIMKVKLECMSSSIKLQDKKRLMEALESLDAIQPQCKNLNTELDKLMEEVEQFIGSSWNMDK